LKENRKEEEEVEEEEGCKRKSFSPTTTVISEGANFGWRIQSVSMSNFEGTIPQNLLFPGA